jgi:hypothetical protein
MGAISFNNNLDKGADNPNKIAATRARRMGFRVFCLIIPPTLL